VASGGKYLPVVGKLMGKLCPSLFARIRWTSCENSHWISDSSLALRSTSKMGVFSLYEILQISFSGKQQLSGLIHSLGTKVNETSDIAVQYCNTLTFSSSQILIIRGFTHFTSLVSSKIKSGATTCQDTIWTSSTSIACKIHSVAAIIMKISFSLGNSDYEWQTRSYRSNATASLCLPNNGPATGSSLMQIIGRDFSSYDLSSRQRTGDTDCEQSAWRSSSRIYSKIAKMKHSETMPVILSATNYYVMTLLSALKIDSNSPTFNISEISVLQAPSSGSVQVLIYGRTVLRVDKTASARIW
jgi:hypothetical protein